MIIVVFFTNVPVSAARLYNAASERKRELQREKKGSKRGPAITGTGECFRKTSRGPQGPQPNQSSPPKQQPFNSNYKPEGAKNWEGKDGSKTKLLFSPACA